MDDSIQETVDVTRNDKASGVGLLTTTTSHLVNVLFPVHTNDAIQITFMISRERRADFCPFFPYRECSVISVLYLCYICAVCPALDFYITNLVTVFVMSWVMSLCTMPHCDVLFIAVSPIDLSPLKFIYHLLNHLLLNDTLFWSDRHRLNYSGTLVFWRG